MIYQRHNFCEIKSLANSFKHNITPIALTRLTLWRGKYGLFFWNSKYTFQFFTSDQKICLSYVKYNVKSVYGDDLLFMCHCLKRTQFIWSCPVGPNIILGAWNGIQLSDAHVHNLYHKIINIDRYVSDIQPISNHIVSCKLICGNFI